MFNWLRRETLVPVIHHPEFGSVLPLGARLRCCSGLRSWLRLRLRLGFWDVKMLGDCIIIHDDDDDDDDDDVHDEKPYTLVKKVVRKFDRGTRGQFLRKAVPRHGGGGGK